MCINKCADLVKKLTAPLLKRILLLNSLKSQLYSEKGNSYFYLSQSSTFCVDCAKGSTTVQDILFVMVRTWALFGHQVNLHFLVPACPQC